MDNKKTEIIFVKKPHEKTVHAYCHLCFYNGNDKQEKLNKYPKPENTKCYHGASGFYMQYEYMEGL